MNGVPEWMMSLVESEHREEDLSAERVRAADVSHPWPLLFEAYRRGVDLPGIAETFGVPIRVLERIAERQRWSELVGRLDANPIDGDPVVAQKLERIEKNREKNLEMVEVLRDHLAEQFVKMRDGELEFDVVAKTKEGVVVTQVGPSPKDIKALADAARAATEMTYRALGDYQEAPRGTQQVAASPSAPQITINLPSAVAMPVSPIIENG